MVATGFKSISEYIAAQPASARPVLKRVREAIRKALPGSTEGISYQIPIYKVDGAMVLYFAGFKEHYSIYPATPHLLKGLKKELAGHLHSKATMRFAYDESVPTALITRIAKLRAVEVAEDKVAKKKAAKR